MTDSQFHKRILEAVLFAAAEPLDEETLAARLPSDADLPALLGAMEEEYGTRGVILTRVAKKWALRTAQDVAPYLEVERTVRRRLSKAAVETLAIIAYHQPVTRGEVEEIRGRALSRGTLDLLLEEGWIKPKGKRQSPGRPTTWGTTDLFLQQFSLEKIEDLPGLEELKAAGLLTTRTVLPGNSELRRAVLDGALDEALDDEDGEGDPSDGGQDGGFEDVPAHPRLAPVEDEAPAGENDTDGAGEDDPRS